MQNIFSDPKKAAVMVAPALAIMVFAILAPIIISVVCSFTDWMGYGAFKWIGLENYRMILFHDPVFWRSLLNALLLMLFILLVQHPIAFIVSAIFSRLSKKMSQVLRTIYFIPAVLTVVVTTKLWIFIYNPNFGLLNKIFSYLNMEILANIAWLSNPSTALISVIIIMAWQGFGWAILFYYAALMTVPEEMKEAAYIDGAKSIQLYRYIIIPYIAPIINTIVILAIIACLKSMETVFLSTEGGPGNLTQFIAVYLYRRAFVYQEYGYGNAISVLFVLIALFFTLFTSSLAKKSLNN